jgi:hypothetical protein
MIPPTITLAGCQLYDVRSLYPPEEGGAVARPRDPALLTAVAIHHDAAMMNPGDLDYSGSSLNEDMARLDIIYRHSLNQGWGGFPYHLVASPNGRAFYTTDVSLFGATVAARNHQLLGVALMGNFMLAQPGDTQLCAAARCLLATWALTGRLLAPWGHRELALPGYATSCPGDTWPQWSGKLLTYAAALARKGGPP